VTLTIADMATSPAGQDGTVGSGDGPRSGRPKRRAFTAEYKMRVLRQYEELADDPQARGALLRREGLYTSHLSEWRKARDASAGNGLADRASGRPRRSAAEAENERLRKENEKLTAELARTKAALDVVGKAHALLELLSESADSSAKRQK
jgi:transposase-like protein